MKKYLILLILFVACDKMPTEPGGTTAEITNRINTYYIDYIGEWFAKYSINGTNTMFNGTGDWKGSTISGYARTATLEVLKASDGGVLKIGKVGSNIYNIGISRIYRKENQTTEKKVIKIE